MSTKPDLKQPPLIVWWILWFAILSGLFVIYTIAGNATRPPPAETAAAESSAWMLCFVPFVVSSVIRWLVLPQIKSAQMALPLFIVGLAMAEATGVLGMFVFPVHKLGLFGLAVLGVLQYVPFFASSYAAKEE